MVDPPVVGYRFRPTGVEIVEKYLRPKNDPNSDTTHVDGVLKTLNISNFDPDELPPQSIMKSEDQVWYFFGRKENKYNRGYRQIRTTKSGFWKITGKPVIIKQKGVEIGKKWVLVFHKDKSTKTKWVMHQYHATPTSTQMIMTYTVCKLKFKGEIEHNHSSNTQMNNSGGVSPRSEVPTSSECPQNQELENVLRQLNEYLLEDTLLEDTTAMVISNLSTDDYELYIQEDRNDQIPKKPITGVLSGYSSDDDSDSDLISSKPGSIQTSSTCEDSFGSSNHRVDQITNLQESPNSTIKSSQKVSQTPDRETGTGQHKLGQAKTKNKRVGFFYRIIQKFIKKIQLCTSI